MNIITRIIWDSNFNIIVQNTKLYLGPIAFCKGGPTADQSAAQSAMANLTASLTANYNVAFGAQSAILQAVNAAFKPIVDAGINQYGFNKAEDTALRTQASEGTAQNYAQAAKSVGDSLAARGGGNNLLPSGAEESIKANVAGAAAESESNKQLGITSAGYETGRQNFLAATSGDMSVAQMYNPLGYANAAEGAANSQFNMATSLYNQKKAASPWGTIGGLVGGLAGSALGPMGAGIGSKVGGWLGGDTWGGMNPNSSSANSDQISNLNWMGSGGGDSYT